MSQSDPSTSQDGGWRASAAYPWLIWSSAALFYLYSYFHRVAPSVMVSDLMRDFAVGGAVLGTLSALYFYPYALLQVPLGAILDRWGPRRVLSAAALLCAVGTVVLSTAQSVEMAYLGRILIGIGASFAWIGTLILVAIWFPPHRFAMLTGMTSMIGMAGAVGGQAPLAALIGHFGWRQTLLVAAIYGVVLAVIFVAVVRDRRSPGEGGISPLRRKGIWRSLREVAAIRQVWIVGLIVSAVSVPAIGFGGLWGVPYMVQIHGLSKASAAACMSVLLASWGIGAPIFGWLSDRIGRRKLPLLGGAAVAFASVLTVIYVPGLPFWLDVTLFAVCGFTAGSCTISFATAREYTNPSVSGMTLGLVNLMSIGTSAIFQSLIGWFLDLNWDGRSDAGARLYSEEAFQIAFLSLVFCGVVAIAAAASIRETYCKPLQETP